MNRELTGMQSGQRAMKWLLLMAAIAMPFIAWLAQRQTFGPDNATLSDRYPTLLVAAGYAFAIWGPIFVLDLLFAVWQATALRAEGTPVSRIRGLAALGFAFTAAWMVVFPMQLFWLALLVIWGAWACLAAAMLRLARFNLGAAELWLALLPVALHTSWLSLAVFLNTAQVVVAYKLLSTVQQLPWSLVLWVLAAVLVLWVNTRLQRGNAVFALAALWGLVGVFVEQSKNRLAGADASAWVAATLAAVLLAQTVYLYLRRYRADAPRLRTSA